ncbi:MAG: LysR family transcriptional regulator [Rubrivivax sp.]|nr:LysR family transcriptional regulator [Rubrivivax sp.]
MLGTAAETKKRRIPLTVIDKTGQSNPAGQPLVPHLTLHQLAVFVATAQGGSTRAAAERVARSQSAASSALADLETALGVQVFDRVGRRLVLNENGRALLPRAHALLDQAGEIQALFGARQDAPLRVAASFTIGEYLMPALLAGWTRLHPASPVRLRIANTADVIAAVAHFEVDLGFIEGPQTHPDVAVRPWRDDELVVVAGPRHPLAGRVATARQLGDATWVLREHGSGTRQVTDAWLMQHLPQVHVGHELGSTEAIKRVVAEGAGLACLSHHAVASELADQRLVVVRCRLPAPRRLLATVLRQDRTPGETTLRFLRHCGVP